jgi:hypothetical protein
LLTQQDHKRHWNDTTTHRKISALPHMISPTSTNTHLGHDAQRARLVVGEVLDGAARASVAIGGNAAQTSAGTFFRTQTRLCRLDLAAGLSGALPMSLGTDRKPLPVLAAH